MFKEHKQLYEGLKTGKPVCGPIDNSDLTPEDKNMALEVINLIKDKQCRKIN